MELHRGRLFDHVHLMVRDVWASRKFYSVVLGVLAIPIGREGNGWFTADELYVSAGKPASGRLHLAFVAASRDLVERFYRSGLSAGGTGNGAPGERPYHPGYFSAHLLDPDGNNVEAVNHGPVKQTAQSIIIRREV